jgi:hypothetical protein
MDVARGCDGITAEACKIKAEYRKRGKLKFDVPV